jgi:hypothetical protein
VKIQKQLIVLTHRLFKGLVKPNNYYFKYFPCALLEKPGKLEKDLRFQKQKINLAYKQPLLEPSTAK